MLDSRTLSLPHPEPSVSANVLSSCAYSRRNPRIRNSMPEDDTRIETRPDGPPGRAAAAPGSKGPRVLAGSGRSGTTWLLDSLAQANSLRTVFEPLNPGAVPSAAPYANRYLRAAQDCPELAIWMNRVLAGRDRSMWPNLRVRPDRINFSRSPKDLLGIARTMLIHSLRYLRDHNRPTLTKFIRGNLLLGWLSRQLSARVVLLLRHPGGVVASRLKTAPAAWDDPAALLRTYLSDPVLVADHLDRVADLLNESLDPVEIYTALWCIENLIPMRQADDGLISIVHYEPLLANDDREWRRVLDSLDLDHRPTQESLSRPSQQASHAMKRRTFTEQHVGRWIDALSEKQRQRVDFMLERFGITAYRTSDPFPLAQSQGFRRS